MKQAIRCGTFIIAASIALSCLLFWADRDEQCRDLTNWRIIEISPAEARLITGNPLFVEASQAGDWAWAGRDRVNFAEENWDDSLRRVLGQWSPERPVLVLCGSDCRTGRAIALKLLGELPGVILYVIGT